MLIISSVRTRHVPQAASVAPPSAHEDPVRALSDQLAFSLDWIARHGTADHPITPLISRLVRRLRQARRFDAGKISLADLATLSYLRKLPLHLPFPHIALTLETAMGLDCVLAEEISPASAAELLRSHGIACPHFHDEGAILVQGFRRHCETTQWEAGGIGLLVSRQWLAAPAPSQKGGKSSTPSLLLNAIPLPVLGALDALGAAPGAHEKAVAQAVDALFGLLTFCEALAKEDLRQDHRLRSSHTLPAYLPIAGNTSSRQWRPALVDLAPPPTVIRLGAVRYHKAPSRRPGLRHTPCEHYRRGHWRLLSRTRYVWVRPCLVGTHEGEFKRVPNAKKHYVLETNS